MRTLHIVQSGSQYTVDKFHFETLTRLVLYLRGRGVAQENILDIIEVLAREGKYTMEQA
jgi:hypothetical protein